MKNRTHLPCRMKHMRRAALVVAIGLTTACASANVGRGGRDLSRSNLDLTRVGRILVAGFVPSGAERIDLNRETVRLLQTELRRASVPVVDSDAVELPRLSRSDEGTVQRLGAITSRCDRDGSEHVLASHADDAVFTNVSYWRRLGEEYAGPLILTGTVRFNPVAPRSQRTVLRRRMLPSLRGFKLQVRLVFIRGTTGEVIDAVTLQPLTMHAASGRESALSLYFRLMDRTMPSILVALEQKASHRSNPTAVMSPPRAQGSRALSARATSAKREPGAIDD